MKRKLPGVVLLALGAAGPMSGAVADDPTPAGPPAVIEAALAGAELDTVDGWAFRRTRTTRAGGDLAEVTVTRFDPARPAGERCTEAELDLATDDTGAGEERPCEEAPERPLYGELRELLLDAHYEPLSATDEVAQFRIRPGDETRGFKMGGVDVQFDDGDAKRLVGSVSVRLVGAGAPYVEQVLLGLEEPAGKLVARLSRLDIEYRYAPDPATGVKLIRSFDVGLDLRLFGMFNVSTDVQMAFDEYRPAAP